MEVAYVQSQNKTDLYPDTLPVITKKEDPHDPAG